MLTQQSFSKDELCLLLDALMESEDRLVDCLQKEPRHIQALRFKLTRLLQKIAEDSVND